ncbi:MAG: BamA/TamA family outer membrane protein [Bacteroidales bacterium]|nr:BamA/TamA family outer membrane protein [Bacteroidales bacterium]
MKGKWFHIILVMLAAAMLSSCTLRRFVPEGKYLVKSNKVVIEEKGTEINKSDVSKYISLKPYKSAIRTNIPTWIYYEWERHPKSPIWKWLNKNFGKQPVYYEKSEANNSANQMMRYLDNVGYFNSKVTHEVKMKEKSKKARVTYHIYPTKPYRVKDIDYVIEDSLVRTYIMRDSTNFPLHVNDIYNAYSLDEQREIITERLKNSGYYYFNRDHIYFEVDSNFMNHTLGITMRLKKSDLAYKKYRIRDISIYPDFSVFKMNSKPVDSAKLTTEFGLRRKFTNEWNFYYYDKPRVKPQTFSRAIHIAEGLPYNLRSVTSTYKSLSNYRLFSNVNIQFDSVPNDSLNLLDCRITMQQNDIHSFTIQAEGTNSGGDLGIKGSLVYTNKNIFHGAETFQLSLRGGLEMQKLLDAEAAETGQKIFNTREGGITASIIFPKFLSPFAFNDFARDYMPTTSVSLGFNAQIRYYYSRYITTASYSYDWKGLNRISHTFTPIYLNGVKIANINPAFQAYLDAETSQRKKDQYSSHLLLGARYSFIYTNQRLNQEGSFIYLRTDIETSGNLLSLFNKTKLINEHDGHHDIFGIRYAQYVRTSIDFRQHLDLGHESWLVFREFMGIGVPYGNSRDLPFERSFYGGGSNGLRGWLYRTVGPGGSVPTEEDFEKTGDIQLEVNAEYRFPIYNIFNGAVFVDAGNVWGFYPNEDMPNAEFRFNSFYKQIALDAGVGLRIDVSFLIIRLDFAYAMRNPFPDETGNYWRFGKGKNLRMQMGIGYPF